MTWVILLGVVMGGLFTGVLLYGAPYVPTLRPQVETALDLLALKPGQTLLELGCGDGKVLRAAAERGLQAVGVELNPVLALVAWVRTRRYGGAVRVVYGNFWQVNWPPSDGVFVFLLDRYMGKLDVRMQEYRRPLVSVAFKIPDKLVASEKNGVFLYRY